MARNLKKEILHAEFDVTKMLRQRGTGLSAAIDGYGGAEAGHLDEGIYSATNVQLYLQMMQVEVLQQLALELLMVLLSFSQRLLQQYFQTEYLLQVSLNQIL